MEPEGSLPHSQVPATCPYHPEFPLERALFQAKVVEKIKTFYVQ